MDCLSYNFGSRIISNNNNRRDRIILWALKTIRLEMAYTFLVKHTEKIMMLSLKRKKCKTHTKEKENNNECCHSEEEQYLKELEKKL